MSCAFAGMLRMLRPIATHCLTAVSMYSGAALVVVPDNSSALLCGHNLNNLTLGPRNSRPAPSSGTALAAGSVTSLHPGGISLSISELAHLLADAISSRPLSPYYLHDLISFVPAGSTTTPPT